MPQAAHHEMKIVKLPEGNRFAYLVYCEGCKWQGHCLPEEDAQQKASQHQKTWGYTPKKAEEKAPVVAAVTPAVTQPVTPVNTTPAIAGVVPAKQGGK